MENPTFRLEGVVRARDEEQDFEGPLSLILMLLSKNKIEIRDIKIAEILDQYLDYLARMESMDLEIASEFVQMAAYLLYIKTRTLLQGETEVSELQELMTSLEQLRCRDTMESVKTVLPVLAEASQEGLLLCTKPPEPISAAATVYDYRHEPTDLLESLYSVFSRSGAKAPGPPDMRYIAPSRIVYGVREKSREIIDRLRRGPESLRALYSDSRSRSEVVATFLSVLELCGMGRLTIECRDDDFILSFTGGDTDEILNAIEE